MIRSNLADALAQAGFVDEAMDHLRKAIVLGGPDEPSSGPRHAKLAGLHLGRGEIVPALEHYEKAVAFPGSQPVMRCQWCRILCLIYAQRVYASDRPDAWSQEHFEKAMQQLESGIKLAASVTGLPPNFAKDFQAEACGTLAKRLLDMLMFTANSANGMLMATKKAAADRRLGNTQYKQIRGNVDRILKQAGGSAPARRRFQSIQCLCDSMMVQLCVIESNFEAAVKYGDSFFLAVNRGTKIEEHDKNMYTVRRNLCQACMGLERYAQAKMHIDEVLKLCQSEPRATFLDDIWGGGDCGLIMALETAGTLADHMSEYGQAEEHLSRQIRLLETELQQAHASDPTSMQTFEKKKSQAVAHINLGSTFKNQGQLQKAADSFKRAGELATNTMAEMRAMSPMKATALYTLIALFGLPAIAESARRDQATILSALGNSAEALGMYQQQLDAGDLPVMARYDVLTKMGQIYEGLGKTDDAVTCYKQAQALAVQAVSESAAKLSQAQHTAPEAEVAYFLADVVPAELVGTLGAASRELASWIGEEDAGDGASRGQQFPDLP
eukprot:SAG22_NODE_426_length_10622_cov_8.088853_4_plen_554_part_01